ncbi:hypothetical protein [Noviluteimonas gilva]|uniref:Uncharacterized protein n=1 Tax=Noviluteimonas gilva TaxID=2682097 RepID=A0A7C9LG22_9GAMM|nr:hypothetical protein [Lysobacter gilvus]MUV13581.1 hypothetical protein [Lysobacter gilvus]
MLDCLIAIAPMLEEMAHAEHLHKRLKEAHEAGDHGMYAAILKVEREREDHKKALVVARASAPVVNVTVRNYY